MKVNKSVITTYDIVVDEMLATFLLQDGRPVKCTIIDDNSEAKVLSLGQCINAGSEKLFYAKLMSIKLIIDKCVELLDEEE